MPCGSQADADVDQGELSLDAAKRAEYNQLKTKAGAATAALQEQIRYRRAATALLQMGLCEHMVAAAFV